MFERRLIILALPAVVVRFGGWTGVRCCVLGASAASGRSDGLLGFWAFAFLLFCAIASVASHMGEDGSMGLVPVFAWVLGFGVGYLGGHLVH